jgi:hypothetical protein
MSTTVSINYGTRTEYGTDTNVNSLASAAAKAIGGVSNSSTKCVGFKIDATIKLATTGVTSSGILYFYLVESADGGTTYTDGINVTSTGDQASSLKNATVVFIAQANANSQVINVVFDLLEQYAAKDHSLVVLNSSGATISSAGNSVYYTPITYTQA